ncbi:permease [Jatrophihabitans lederbergiae]|uniref:Permease n=1 Tax=Jatrophihabitans lederbergiae TaxID=3075547 RepID=A0ABU2JB40_9ACTN|nr:permease [Jatrophihabitans sp. DSM 44399]MDT0262196.1 permease [Jatrophihabitans sp. DSM 44399]
MASTGRTVGRQRWSARRLEPTDAICAILAAAALARVLLGSELSHPRVQAWTTVFIAICVQAAPFAVLGVAMSTLVSVLVPPAFFARALPAAPGLSVPLAGLAGTLLPGCECASVPVAASLSRRGVPPGPAVAFLLSAPAINPVVLVATSVAFPGHPAVVLARFVASLCAAVLMGWLWSMTGWPLPARRRQHDHGSGTVSGRALATASHDIAQTIGLLVVGAASAATVAAVVPQQLLTAVADNPVTAVCGLAALAVVLAVCSESDAFIAASLSQFSLTARLTFLVVGPAVDVKLVAMHAGTFGRTFALRFAPLTWLIALLASTVTGAVLL